MKIADMGVEQCRCGALKPIDRHCRECQDEKLDPPAFRCLGLHCPKKEGCALYKPSTPGTHNLTRWIDPPFDPMTGTCENETPIVWPLLNNPME